MHERQNKVVMAGHSRPKDGVASASLRPAIHVSFAPDRKKDVDARVKPGHDELGRRPRHSALARFLMSLPTAAISLFVSSLPASADLKLCNRMSYVVEAAIGIDDKSATATRGWFRIDPAACRVVLQGALTADRILLNARALGVYGASPIPQSGSDTLCVAPESFVIAAARQCRGNQTPAPFTQITPTKTDDGHLIGLTYQGLRHGPKEVLDAIGRGEQVSPLAYYMRVSCSFETSSEKYGWLNRVVTIAHGHRLSGGAIYNVFEIV